MQPLTIQSKSRSGETYDINTVNSGKEEADPGCHWQPNDLFT